MHSVKWIIGFIFFISHSSYSQIPVQLFAGNQAVEYSFFWDNAVDKKGKLNFFNLTFFTLDYEESSGNSYEIYQVATYNFTKNWGIASGGRFTDGQFLPQVAVSFQVETKDLYFNIFPTIQYLTVKEHMGYSLFGLLIYTPKISNTLKLFHQLVFEPLFDSSGHIYSYQQLRIGLEYKDLFQFGLGLNLEQTGNRLDTISNYGLFIRKDLK